MAQFAPVEDRPAPALGALGALGCLDSFAPAVRQKPGEPGSAPVASAKKAGRGNFAKELRDCAGQLREWRAEGLALAKSIKGDYGGQRHVGKQVTAAYTRSKNAPQDPVSILCEEYAQAVRDVEDMGKRWAFGRW